MKLEERIVLFSKLGEHINKVFDTEDFLDLLEDAKSRNAWFTIDNLKKAINNITRGFLLRPAIENFVNNYPTEYFNTEQAKKIGIIAAGNVPLVGFQDFFNVILAGHIALYKPSSNDEILIQYIRNQLINIDSRFADRLKIVDRLNDADAIIATGSGNSSRYFEYYFGTKPHIIRKNRVSVAILNGNESKVELANLANDIFEYFGLGCRNVSKLFVPENYDFTLFFEAIEYWSIIRMHSKYNNNYDYMKSIFLVNQVQHLDNGFLLLKEDSELASPISVLFFEYYKNTEELNFENYKDKIQVIISNNKNHSDHLSFGQSQCPTLLDYADNVDVIKFLSQIK